MATVFTVHGTFANGETKGENWWQSGSNFEQELKRLVQGQGGPLVVEPLIWDGKNSETSRRRAGAELARRMRKNEKAGEPYVLIGHSHGGSVILAAILQSVAKRESLPRLSKWITVGTPFISFSPKRNLFSRLGISGRAAYLAVFTLLVMLGGLTLADDMPNRTGALVGGLLMLFLGLASYRTLNWLSLRDLVRSGGTVSDLDGDRLLWPRFGLGLGLLHATMIWIGLTAAFALATPNASVTPLQGIAAAGGVIAGLCILHLALAIFNRSLIRRETARRADLLTPIMNAMVGFRHRHDEAIAGLGRVHEVEFRIFGRQLVVSQFMFAAVLVAPIVLLSAVASPEWMRWLAAQFHYWTGNEGVMLVGDGHVFAENVRFFNKALSAHFLVGLLPFGSEGDGWTMLGLLVGFLILPALFFAFSLLVIGAARIVGLAVSEVLSRVLDKVAWGQVRASAFGADMLGERGHYAAPQPGLAKSAQAVLPDALGQEMSAISDAASAKSLSKLRMAIADLALSGEGGNKSEIVTNYLSWDELIHTAYFKVPRFIKLVAYAVAVSPGFEPTAQFRADADFTLVGNWYESIINAADKI